MDRREVLKGIVSVSSLLCMGGLKMAVADGDLRKLQLTLPELPYSYDALSPVIDGETMRLHHGAHHRAYVDKANIALSEIQPDLFGGDLKLEKILANLERVPEKLRTPLRNNGGGHLNHTLFWETMGPGGEGEPSKRLAKEILSEFGSISQFKEKFELVGTSHFGSGWVWLSLNSDGKLDLTSYPNQDTPAMFNRIPLIGNDLWEHAYYLSYRNRRAEYLKAWWKLVKWDVVEKRFVDGLKAVGML